jgi:LAO/AO transport system kinase
MRGGASAWKPPLVETVAVQGKGTAELLDAVGRFREHLTASGEGRVRRRNALRERIRVAAERMLRRRLWQGDGAAALDAAADAAIEEKRNPYELAAELARRLHERGAPEAPGGVTRT